MPQRKIHKGRQVNQPIRLNEPLHSDKFKIAIIQTGCYGDNINSTLMLDPLHTKYPNAIIDIHTSSQYAQAFYNNHLISNIVQYKAESKNESLHLMKIIPDTLKKYKYDLILNPHPMINSDKWTSLKNNLGTNIICAWVRALEDNDIDYELPLTTHLYLTKSETNKVKDYLSTIKIDNKFKNIMEIHGESGQTFWDGEWTKNVIDKLCGRGEIVFISHRDAMPEYTSKYPDLCFAVNHLSIRECAELFNHCDRFFSVSSGLSNACNTNWCKKDIQWIEVVNKHPTLDESVVSSAPIRSSDKTFWFDNNLSKFLELV